MEKVSLNFLKRKYFEYNKPVPYKELFIYPALIEDYYDFYGVIDCLLLKKNRDPKGISMSELDYFLYQNDLLPDEMYFYKFCEICRICFHIQAGLFCPCCDFSYNVNETFDFIEKFREEGKNLNTIFSLDCPKCKKKMIDTIRFWVDENNKAFIGIKNITLDKNDFKEIKTIITYQNILDYDDKYIDPDLEDDQKEAEKLKSKGMASPSLDKQKSCIMASTSYKSEELNKMPIREFAMLLKTIDDKLHYQIYKTGESSGAVTFKNGIDHWIYKKEKTLLDEMVTYDSFAKKMQHVAK
jgi:hypothetical protein